MLMYYWRFLVVVEEVEMVIVEVNFFFEKLCVKIIEYDVRFKMLVFFIGSFVEGMKVGCLDEFDFVLCLDQLVDKINIVMIEQCLEIGYVCFRFIEIFVLLDYLFFFDVDGYFLVLFFLQYLFRFLR